MLEVLQFIFSSFWVWLGFVVIVGAGCSGIAEIVAAWRKRGS